MVWVAFNQMFIKGKKAGKPFRNVVAKTKQGAINMNKKANRNWNKLSANRRQRFRVKTVAIKQLKR